MKLKNLLIVLAIVVLSACTQRICPTYSKLDTPKTEKPAAVKL